MKTTSKRIVHLCLAGLSVMVFGKLQAQCTADFTYTVSGATVNFTSTSTGVGPNTMYSWIFGDSQSTMGSSSTATHTYASTGTYNVCLGIGDASLGCLDSVCYNVSVIVTGVSEQGRNRSSLSSFPNPFSNASGITYITGEQGAVEISLFDMLGNKVLSVEKSASKAPGKYEAVLDGTTLTGGVYFLKLTLNGQSVTQKVTVVK